MSWPIAGATLGPFFSSAAMAEIFCDRARVQAMLDVEAALGRAQASCGLIPERAADAIGKAAQAKKFDLERLGRETLKAGNLAIPLVKELTALVAASDKEAARWVHWGATSQDIIDTGLVLQMRSALAALAASIETLGAGLAALAEQHAETPIVARTLMQQAIPTSFGLKAAGWLSALMRSEEALRSCRTRVLVLQFGGAAGNLASLAPDGIRVSEALARELELSAPDLPWHSERDRIAEMASALAVLTGVLGKMGRDLALMAQTEVGEFREPSGDGRGGSSTLPHKANPIACARILAAAKRAPGLAATVLAAMDHEHERSLSNWHVEWEVLPELFRLASASLEAACFIAENGVFDAERMRANLELTSGLVMAEAASMALGRKIGKSAAHRLVERAAQQAVRDNRPLRDCLASDPDIAVYLRNAELDALFAPQKHLGSAPELTLRAVAAWRARPGMRGGQISSSERSSVSP
jgi:3-carboxy-cis,cis-muconate cycloisomerase